MPTARNARGIDVLAYSRTASTKVALQVKSLSKRSPVPLGKDVDDLMGDWWVVLHSVAAPQPKAFVLSPLEVMRLAHRGEKEGRVSFWLQPQAYCQPQFEEAWGRIGDGHDA